MKRCFWMGLVGAAAVAPGVTAAPLLSMRLRMDETKSAEAWQASFKAIAEHPGCCDEIWFSTGCGVPSLDWHRMRAQVMSKAAADVRAKGIVPSLQFQATIGHGDGTASEPGMLALKTWTGWTDWAGTETKECNCPRQPAFLAYLRAVSEIYAPLGFGALWIDDDLRIAYHQPAKSWWRLSGCWCETCLTAFNKETDGAWTRSALAETVRTNEVVAARWRAFSIDGLCLVARTIAETFHEHAPQTMMALQHASGEENIDQAQAVLKVLHDVSGRPVGSRPGGGSYYDDDPNAIVLKSIQTGWFRSRLGETVEVGVWTPEIESWPRTYYSRSSQGVLLEGFTALMYGMNSISFFISDCRKEDPSFYGRTHWATLAAAAPVLRGYAAATADCLPIGLTMPGKPQLGIRRAAIPVLAGYGRSCGSLTEAECARTVNVMTSADVQKLRDDLDRRAGGLPAVVSSPFSGLMQIHVDRQGRLATVALVNTRIAAQGPVRVKLRGLEDGARSVVWRMLCADPAELEVERTPGGTFVTIPEIGAWNAGYLSAREAR